MTLHRILPHLAMIAVLGTGCRGSDLSFDCDFQKEAYDAEVADEGVLLDAIPAEGPYPVAMMLSEVGINELLNSTVNTDVPFTGTIPFGPIFLDFEPETEPTIELADSPGCVDCVIFSLKFGVELTNQDSSISSGSGIAKMSIPLRLENDEAETTATLIAGYDEIEIIELDFSVYGFDSEEHEALGGAIQTLMEEKIREDFGPTPLMSLNSWALGNGSVKLLAREIFVFPEEKTLALGMATNLELPTNAGLEKPVLQEGTPMGLHFDNELFLALIERMMTEGEIGRRYDQDGKVNDEGVYGVTVQDLDGNDSGNNEFDSFFRVWRIAEGYCGFAEVFMRLAVDHDGKDITIMAGEPSVLDGQGSGAVAAEEEELVEENIAVVDEFKKSVADQMSLAVNYDAISLEGSTMVVTLQDVTVNPDGLFMNMDFFVVEDEG